MFHPAPAAFPVPAAHRQSGHRPKKLPGTYHYVPGNGLLYEIFNVYAYLMILATRPPHFTTQMPLADTAISLLQAPVAICLPVAL